MIIDDSLEIENENNSINNNNNNSNHESESENSKNISKSPSVKYESEKEKNSEEEIQNFSIIVKNINKYISLIDFYSILYKYTPKIKKITMLHDPNFPIISTGIFQIDYENKQSCLDALNIINNNKIINNIKGFENINAYLSENFIDNLYEIMKNYCKVLCFYNLNINTNNALEFKYFILNYIQNNNELDIEIFKLRQYTTKILIEFNKIPNCLKKFIDNEEEYFQYHNKNIPIKYVIKPLVNIGKYKEKNLKLSMFNISEEDKIFLFNR